MVRAPASLLERVSRTGLILGLIAGAVTLFLTHPEHGGFGGLATNGAWVASLLALMAIWWMTEAVDFAATALLPAILLPALGITTAKEALAPYADTVIFLMAGGMSLGIALERHGLSLWLARGLLRAAPRTLSGVLGAIMLATALTSAFVSNAATTAIMLPIALAAVASIERSSTASNFSPRQVASAAALLPLSVAYAASIGGTISPVGSPPNAIAMQWLRGQQIDMSFAGWMAIALPFALTLLAVTWFILRRMGGIASLPLAPGALIATPPRLDGRAWTTLTVFVMAAAAWITSPLWRPALPQVNDGVIAMAALVALMVIPCATGTESADRHALSWNDVSRIPWSVLILLGGGLSLADAMQESGVSAAIANAASGVGGAPVVIVCVGLVAAIVFASEIASNTALAATAVPLLGALSPVLGMSPEALAIPVVLAASCAFMLPVGTPPNAMVFATGRIPLSTMLRIGFVLNLASVALISLLAVVLRWMAV